MTATTLKLFPRFPAGARLWSGFAALAAALRDGAYALPARSLQRRQLARLSDRMLEDIGLTRAEALAEADKPFWLR